MIIGFSEIEKAYNSGEDDGDLQFPDDIILSGPGLRYINGLIIVLTQIVPPHPTLSPACAEASAGRHQGRGHLSCSLPLRGGRVRERVNMSIQL